MTEMDALLQVAKNLHLRGDYADAVVLYATMLMAEPKNAVVHRMLGQALGAMGRRQEALASLDRAIELAPDVSKSHFVRGAVLGEFGRAEEAIAAFDRALALESETVDERAIAWQSRGNLDFDLARYDDAYTAYSEAQKLKPDFAEAWLGLGNVAHFLRHHDEAKAHYDKAISLKPDLAEAYLGHGAVANDEYRYRDALVNYEKAIALKPNLPMPWLEAGNILRKIERRGESLEAIDMAISLKPDFAQSYVGRGLVLHELNRIPEALASFDKALSIKADLGDAITCKIYVLDFADGAGFEEQQAVRRYWWDKVGSPIADRSQIKHHPNTKDRNRRIKVGYVSGDFHEHSSSDHFLPMLSHHDKTGFEITCYACTGGEDYVTKKFRKAADHWRNVTQLSDDELCRQIQEDQIDILVDLSSYTAGSRITVFARKVAPVQVTAGAVGTGIPMIDYLFSDPVTCPKSVRHLFAEKIYDLPAIMTFDPEDDGIEIFDPPCLTNGYITFGVFNRASKISDEVVAIWARILMFVPGSKILFKHYAFSDPAVCERYRERFAKHGIEAGRLSFLGGTGRIDHLLAFEHVDISLDPFPQNGGISTLDSLGRGVPVVTKLGNSISGRAAGSILTSVGLGDWVADSVGGYVAIATGFAERPAYLRALRHEIPSMLTTSAVGNPAVFTKAVEAAYRTMWEVYCLLS